MNGYSAVEEATKLIGVFGGVESLKETALPIINLVLCEMGQNQTETLSSEIPLSTTNHKAALISGVASKVAAAIGDTNSAEWAHQAFKRQLAILKGSVSAVKDILPKGEF